MNASTIIPITLNPTGTSPVEYVFTLGEIQSILAQTLMHEAKPDWALDQIGERLVRDAINLIP